MLWRAGESADEAFDERIHVSEPWRDCTADPVFIGRAFEPTPYRGIARTPHMLDPDPGELAFIDHGVVAVDGPERIGAHKKL